MFRSLSSASTLLKTPLTSLPLRRSYFALASTQHSCSSVNRLPRTTQFHVDSLASAAARKLSREASKRVVEFRNAHYRSLHLSSQSTAGLYLLKVSFDPALSASLRLDSREKRGRLFVDPEAAPSVRTLEGLKREVNLFFRNALHLDSCELVAEPSAGAAFPVSSDADVARLFAAAKQEGVESQQVDAGPSAQRRPTVKLHITSRDVPPPFGANRSSPPQYLSGMPDPSSSPTMTMLSFYSFPPTPISDVAAFCERLKRTLKPFECRGRIYVAEEGVNAQMAVPTSVLSHFRECCMSIPELSTYMENGLNIDPIPISMHDFYNSVDPTTSTPIPPPFKKLHIRGRNQIVADSLLDTSSPPSLYNWQDAGYDMPPKEWHEKLKVLLSNEITAAPIKPIIIDCRNSYESEVGNFVGAEKLQTNSFRESYDRLRERLENVDKETPIMAYCTGGIRCVKVGAFLRQELGFQNVSRLAGGIIAYDRFASASLPSESSLFLGTNYVFDGRVGREITDHKLGTCVTCGAPSSLLSNCNNTACHKKMVQCEKCRPSFQSTCSTSCLTRVVNSKNNAAAAVRTATMQPLSAGGDIEAYCASRSTPAPQFYDQIERNTKLHFPTGAHMVAGSSQGRLLAALAGMTRSGRVLEIGTFTGYATCCFAEGIAASRGEGENPRGYVLTLERDVKAHDLATQHVRCFDLGVGEAAARAAEKAAYGPLAAESGGNVQKVQLKNGVTVELKKVDDALAFLESTKFDEGFDLVFVDADKSRLYEYVKCCASGNTSILKRGGIMLVDNVLWKGSLNKSRGSEKRNGSDTSDADDENVDINEDSRSRRQRKLVNQMLIFNEDVRNDPSLEVTILQIRDGVSVIRRREQTSNGSPTAGSEPSLSSSSSTTPACISPHPSSAPPPPPPTPAASPYVRKRGVSLPSALSSFVSSAGPNLIVIDVRNPDFILEPGDASTCEFAPLPGGSSCEDAAAQRPYRPRAVNVPFDRKRGVMDESLIPSKWIERAGGKQAVPIITHCGGGGRGQKAKEYLESRGFQNVVNGGGPEDEECWAIFGSK